MNSDSHSKGDCGTSFKSKVNLREYDNGPSISYQESEGAYIWPDAEHGNVIEFTVQTKEADTCVAKLTTMDLAYVSRVTNSVAEQLGPDATAEKLNEEVMKNLDMHKFFPVVRSKTFDTSGSDDEYTGQFAIENTFKQMPLMLTLHYGYSGNAERSDLQTSWDIIGKEVLWFIVEELVWLIVCTVVVAASGGTAAPAVYAIYAAKVAKWGSRAAKIGKKGKKAIQLSAKAAQYGQDATKAAKALYYSTAAMNMIVFAGAYMWRDWNKQMWGLIDVNKSGCQFPAGGYNHVYSFEVGGGNEEWLAFLSTMTPESMGYTIDNSEVEAAGVSTAMSSPFMIYTAIALIGLGIMYAFSGGGEK